MNPPVFDLTVDCAKALDSVDPLASFRDRFEIPTDDSGKPKIYFVGNSLGALPRKAREYVGLEMDRWSGLGVDGHFTGDLSWVTSHSLVTDTMASIVGARANEVTIMNTLTVNLHLLMISFYEPTPSRHKILIEDHAFPSDHFAVESQIRQRGFDPAESLITVSPRAGSELLDPQDILDAIAAAGDELAMVLLPGVQYYTGQVLPMAEIVAAGHAVGAKVGLDLAHAAGNVPLQLHDWDVDFAAWCTYKYLNGGPGSIGGAFVHERYVDDQSLPKLLGWWGTNGETRFQMKNEFEAIPTIDSWQISNAPILSLAGVRAGLDVFAEAGGIDVLRSKSEQQIHYFDYLLTQELAGKVGSITPTAIGDRGAQFALTILDPSTDGRAVFEALEDAGVVCDWRYPNVIRAAPVPLYNSFEDIHRFIQILKGLLA